MTLFQDRVLTCRDCGQPFTFTVGEQEFYQSRGLTNDPGRCPNCRQARKASRGEGGGYAYASTGGNGGYDAAGGYDRPRRELFSATCSNCGNEARVPFQPRGDKPVYCSNCFDQVRGGRY
jgi:CxxC-x17-CxxC domain-containing protein